MPSTRKKVVVRKWTGELARGYLPAEDFLASEEGELPGLGLLGLDGNVTFVRVDAVKWISFVRDFPSREEPERLLQKAFRRRPRNPGLWVRVQLKDADSLEGLARNDLSLLDPGGFLLIPPDTRSNIQRIFVPRQAITQLEILAVVRMTVPRNESRALQENLFDGGA